MLVLAVLVLVVVLVLVDLPHQRLRKQVVTTGFLTSPGSDISGTAAALVYTRVVVVVVVVVEQGKHNATTAAIINEQQACGAQDRGGSKVGPSTLPPLGASHVAAHS